MEDWLSSTAERGLSLAGDDRPRIGAAFRLRTGDTPEARWLVGEEKTVLLNETAAEIMARCDGRRSVGVLVEELRALYLGVDETEISEAVRSFLELALNKGWIVIDRSPGG